jgi:hypothetical protein
MQACLSSRSYPADPSFTGLPFAALLNRQANGWHQMRQRYFRLRLGQLGRSARRDRRGGSARRDRRGGRHADPAERYGCRFFEVGEGARMPIRPPRISVVALDTSDGMTRDPVTEVKTMAATSASSATPRNPITIP